VATAIVITKRRSEVEAFGSFSSDGVPLISRWLRSASVAGALRALVVVEVEARLVAGLQGLKDPEYPIELILFAHLCQFPIIYMRAHHDYLRPSLAASIFR
jgi:hypothetical protein